IDLHAEVVAPEAEDPDLEIRAAELAAFHGVLSWVFRPAARRGGRGSVSARLQVRVLEVPDRVASVPTPRRGDALPEDLLEERMELEQLDPDVGHRLRAAVEVAVPL